MRSSNELGYTTYSIERFTDLIAKKVEKQPVRLTFIS